MHEGEGVCVRRVSAILFVGVALTACESSEDAYDRGYQDGMALGYNTACEIRSTLVAAEWSNENYAEGFAEGQTDGIIACNEDKRNGEFE